jgi:hypothetical protein
MIHPTMITIKIGDMWNPWAKKLLKASIAYCIMTNLLWNKSLSVCTEKSVKFKHKNNGMDD